MKIFSHARPRTKKSKSFFGRPRNEEGSFLVEVLIAGTILVILAGSAITHLSTLTKLKIETETRDRALVLVNSIHEQMNSAGCGLNVSAAKDIGTLTPWTRVTACAFSAASNVKANPYGGVVLDQDNNLAFTNPNLTNIANFCAARGTGGKCELGDQSFDRVLNVNNSQTPSIFGDAKADVTFHVSVNYWFEKTGVTNSSLNFGAIIGTTQPDIIVRKVTVWWVNNQTSTGRETVTVVKRQNIPADSIEFSSNSRVGQVIISNTPIVMNIPYTDATGPHDMFQVTRSAPAGSAIWFPFIDNTAGTYFTGHGYGSISSTLPLHNKVIP